MLEIPVPFIGFVSFRTSFLFSITGDHCAVKINGDVVNAQLVKKPVLKNREYLSVPFLGKLPEKLTVCALGRHLFPTEYRLETFVMLSLSQ